MLGAALTGCGNSAGGATGAISVVSREDGSGTRGAFVELCGVEDADGNDATVSSAEITNSTAVMMQTVEGNASAIGYFSMGSLFHNCLSFIAQNIVDEILCSIADAITLSHNVKRTGNHLAAVGNIRWCCIYAVDLNGFNLVIKVPAGTAFFCKL